ncbi:hypothetical protein B0A55_00448 [Friedmanniomyces simplex]|uniref:Uncharacterized protein n=1 Tax=Friedmanniomyces simplex TaxID=329884 RepID=A0A4V5NKW7_9PEZI|nr:hypothetical protein B0A55_00448 [Friedmanniomyces simplex]
MPSSQDLYNLQVRNADAFTKNRIASQLQSHPARPYIAALQAVGGDEGLDKDLKLKVSATVHIEYHDAPCLRDGTVKPVNVFANEKNIQIRTSVPRLRVYAANAVAAAAATSGNGGSVSGESEGAEGAAEGAAEGEGGDMDTSE